MHAWHKKFWRIRYLTLNHISASNYEPVPCINGLWVQKYTSFERSTRKENVIDMFVLKIASFVKVCGCFEINNWNFDIK